MFKVLSLPHVENKVGIHYKESITLNAVEESNRCVSWESYERQRLNTLCGQNAVFRKFEQTAQHFKLPEPEFIEAPRIMTCRKGERKRPTLGFCKCPIRLFAGLQKNRHVSRFHSVSSDDSEDRTLNTLTDTCFCILTTPEQLYYLHSWTSVGK
jgi:hypothetical protein